MQTLLLNFLSFSLLAFAGLFGLPPPEQWIVTQTGTSCLGNSAPICPGLMASLKGAGPPRQGQIAAFALLRLRTCVVLQLSALGHALFLHAVTCWSQSRHWQIKQRR